MMASKGELHLGYEADDEKVDKEMAVAVFVQREKRVVEPVNERGMQLG
jgi:hypothetical protein